VDGGECTVRNDKSVKQILEMVKEKKLTHDEALKLIKNLQLAQKSTTLESAEQSPEHIYCSAVWECAEFKSQSHIRDIKGDLIIFDTDEKLRETYQKNLSGSSVKVVLVKPAEAFAELKELTYKINPGSMDDYLMLIKALNRKNILPLNIIHLWASGINWLEQDDRKRSLQRGIYSIFYLSKAMVEYKVRGEVRLLSVFRSITEEDYPLNAAVSAFSKTVKQENPKYCYKTIDICSELVGVESYESKLADILAGELTVREKDGMEIRYDEGRRYVRRLREIATQYIHNQPFDFMKNSLFRAKGVYLITGGNGSLGRIFAQYLAEKVSARVVLVGRSEPSKHMREEIGELCSKGAEVLYMQADISVRCDVERVISEVKSQFGSINGIIHAAGVIRDAFLLRKTKEELDLVFAPKIEGTLLIDECTKKENLDFFALFSSITAELGNAGQADYAYANCFMDRFAEVREKLKERNERHGKTISFNWPLWQKGGMQVDAEIQKSIKDRLGIVSITTETGLEAFEAGLKFHGSQFVVLSGNRKKIMSAIEDKGSIGVSENIQDNMIEKHAKINLQEKTEEYLKNIFEAELKIQASKISSKDSLENYGIDSVMVMNLTRALEKHFGELSKTLFFEYKSISELAGYFVENYGNRLIDKLGTSVKDQPYKVEPEGKESVMQQELRRSRFLLGGTGKTEKKFKFEDEIAIIGVSGRYPKAENLEKFWENLKSGMDCITEIPKERWEHEIYFDSDKGKQGKAYSKWGGFIDGVDRFDPLFFNISPKEAELSDPQERLFLETSWHTVEDAGYTRESLSGKKAGVFVGVMYGQYQLVGLDAFRSGYGNVPNSSYASVANRVSYYFNFHGPSMAVDTMCSSSLTAIHLACDSIRKGECDFAIAGGVNLCVHPYKYLQLSQGKFAATDGRCRSFGEGGDGYVPGEGVGAILLKPVKKAIADGDHIYAVIKGSSINHGGKTNGYTVPNPQAQGELIKDALDRTGINPRHISYLEAHGTGTSLGDPIEINGLIRAYRQFTADNQFCPIGSVKSNIGHLESAAGIASITKVLLQMKHKELVPSIHSDILNPNINFKDSPFYVQRECEEWKKPVIEDNGHKKQLPRISAISSFGAGGSNAHVILEEYREIEKEQPVYSGEQYIIVLSAKNQERLKAYAGMLGAYLKKVCTAGSVENNDKEALLKKIRNELIKVLTHITSVDEKEIATDEDISEYGMDTIGFAELSDAVNQKYDLDIAPAIFLGYRSITAISDYLYKSYKERINNYYFDDDSAKERMQNSQPDNIHLKDIAYTLQVGREAMHERLALIVSSKEELSEKLLAYSLGTIDIEGLHIGSLKSAQIKMDFLLDGREGKEFLKTVIVDRKLSKLAQLWVAGMDIDWNIMYLEQKPCRISLPGYPFSKELCWLPNIKKDVGLDTGLCNSKLHPLIDKNISDFKGYSFSTLLTNDRPYFTGFTTGEEGAIVPSSVYIEMADKAAELAGKDFVSVMKNLAWNGFAAIGSKSEGPKELNISLYPEENEADFEIYLCENGNKLSSILKGTMVFQNETCDKRSIRVLNVEEIKDKCTGLMDSINFYRKLEGADISYNQVYKTASGFYYNKNEALVHIILQDTISNDYEGFTIHPAFLEGALQAANLFANADTGMRQRFVSFIEEAIILGVMPSEGYAHIKYTEENNLDRLSICITDALGQIKAELKNIELSTVESLYEWAEPQRQKLKDRCFHILKKSWRKSEIVDTGAVEVNKSNGRYIVLVNNETLPVVYRLLEQHLGCRMYILKSGDKFQRLSTNELEMNFELEADGRSAAAEVKSDLLFQGVIDLSDLYKEPVEKPHGCMGKIRLIQELIRETKQNAFDILHFTSGLSAIGECTPSLAGAGFAGFIKMLGAEYGKVRSKTVDVQDMVLDTDALLSTIILEWKVWEPVSEIAYIKGTRMIPYADILDTMDENRLMSNSKSAFEKTKGAVVITGGTRGIGFEIASYLVSKGVQKLVLMGIQQLPPKNQWDSIIKNSQSDPSVSEKLKKLIELETRGAEIEIYTGALTAKDKLEVFFENIRMKWGRIAGIIHCAGLSIDRNPAFINKQVEDIERVLEPKIDGLMVLHDILDTNSPDFFILFSSVSALIPALAPGGSDYAAANSFMDHFASYQFNRGNKYYKSIIWPSWKDAGMGEITSPVYRDIGLSSISSVEGLKMLECALTYKENACVSPLLVYSDKFDAGTLLNAKHEKKADLHRTSVKSVNRIETLRDTKTDSNIFREIKKLFAEELRIDEDRLDEDTTFDEFGVDSILISELVKRFENWIGKRLEPSIFLEYPNIRALGEYLYPLMHNQQDVIPVLENKIPQNHSANTGKEVKMLKIMNSRNLILRTGNKYFTKMETGRNAGSNALKVAVIGMACHFPGAQNKGEYWRNLAQGKSSIVEVPKSRWNINRYYSPVSQKGKSISKWGGFIKEIEYFDPKYFAISDEDACYVDPLMRQFLEVSVEAFRDSGYEKHDISNRKVGVFVGSRMGNYNNRFKQLEKNSIIGIGQNFIAAHVAHFFNLKGPNMVIDTACSSSLVSIHLAVQSILQGESELALAGGVDILLDEKPYILLSEGKALSPDGKCYTFDEKANGFVPGEGCGAVVLKQLDRAIADGDQIYAVIEASAVNNDGRTMGMTTPNPEAQSEVIGEALKKAGIEASSISYVETHGTGTMIGDPIELKALTKVFRQFTHEKGFCSVGSVKTNFGHLLSAAGIASFIKVVLSIQNGKIPPTLNCETPNPRFEFSNSPFFPNVVLREWIPQSGRRYAGISSFGFGGTNAHIIVSEPENAVLEGNSRLRTSLAPVTFNRKRYWIDTEDYINTSIKTTGLLEIMDESMDD